MTSEVGVASKEWRRFCERHATAAANQVTSLAMRTFFGGILFP
jgi:hypothetical protein